MGWGVALEYERMGSRPVSEGLQARADEFGFELEHLGITLGTVIHNINLKGELTSDLIQFVRDALNERKVIFFRDQHLTEDEQVAFGAASASLTRSLSAGPARTLTLLRSAPAKSVREGLASGTPM